MLPSEQPDRIHVAFDDHRLVANAGLLLAVTLAQHLGLGELVDNHVDLGDAPGRANPGDKMLTLVASALAGGDCIDDADVLRTGRTAWRSRLRGQGALHSGDLPAQLPVGPRPAAGPSEPGAAGPGLDHWGTTLVLSRRVAHPFGSSPHFTSSPALALGKPVQWRPSTIASPSISCLTAPLAPDPSTRLFNRPEGSRQVGPRASLVACSPDNLAQHRHHGPPHPLGVATAPCTQPNLWGSSPHVSFPCLSSLL